MNKFFFAGMLLAMTATALTSCENDNINPEDYNGKSSNSATAAITTALAAYPENSIVWTKDTTLTESFKVPEGHSLYIEPGVHVTCSSKPTEDHPIEIVVLGNLYSLGTAAKPVVIDSETGKANSWGGIICGYNAEEVVLRHTELADGGATPTESSISFQNKLFKTTIDGGVPVFHFCNTDGKFVMDSCYVHDNYNDQTYFTGGSGIITGCVFADSGNQEDGGEAINVKSGCNLDISDNLIYNACTNGFKLSNAGIESGIASSNLRIYNNTVVDCGWRRTKNKKGGSVWLEKGIHPVMKNNLIADCRYGIKQPSKDGADLAESVLTPNYLFASTATGVKQMAKGYSGVIYEDANPTSQSAGDLNPLFLSFKQSDKMNVNCESDDVANGAPLPYDNSWDFHLQIGSPALTGAATSIERLFPTGLMFSGLKNISWNDAANKQSYYVYSPAIQPYFGAFGTK
ncbi:MAG: right-handed parallel beta-helix repeat-containing protein [Prevotella sp.]|uniref:right-handed parallel beta-helix repeat-containing protein n=1 Tax=Prevotella sp. AGR2160 TaxID=1280674 RepID=UPI00041B2578|nr:right-handed parallel beta-helix repeat-containing protein [Prevotella sp. AGR2160]MDD5861540.1 right-handed parallel beta-helix repeat-containing protein [Prevotella sp.]